MSAFLMLIASGAGIAGLLLVADMIMTDISINRAERSGERAQR